LGISLQDIGEVFQNGISLKGLRALIYSAILANDQENGNEIDYNIYTVGSWLDELEAESINKIVETMLQSKILGNSLNSEIEKPGKPKPSKK
jgi:lipopolysaccharide biosynthesis glycosyltransferase